MNSSKVNGIHKVSGIHEANDVDEATVARIVSAILEQKELSGTGRGKIGSAQMEPVDNIPQTARLNASITLDFAECLMKRVEAEAAGMGMKVVTAVADAAGRPVAVRCMDGAFIGSYDVALNKTYTAIAFQMTTEELGTLSQPGAPLYGIQFTNQGRIVIFGGGIPLKLHGSIIGAFGVSGGTAEQDTYLAHFAEDTFRTMTGQ